MNQFRQGDVLIVPINQIPTSAKISNDKILAHGETSGHGHVMTGETDVLREGEEIYLSVKEESQLQHLLVASGVWTEEHHPITLPKGKYKVIQQREYDAYEKVIRQVRD